jgi:hypothetical protein
VGQDGIRRGGCQAPLSLYRRDSIEDRVCLAILGADFDVAVGERRVIAHESPALSRTCLPFWPAPMKSWVAAIQLILYVVADEVRCLLGA